MVGQGGRAGSAGDGGAATVAELHSPAGIAVDAQGDLYIVDAGNFKVRAVVKGVIRTVAGSGKYGMSDGDALTTRFGYNMMGIAMVGPDGDFIVGDAGWDALRYYHAATQTITLYAGSNTPGYAGDNGRIAEWSPLNSPTGFCWTGSS